MSKLTAAKRRAMPASQFAGPGKSFPVNDPTHQRLAISGATRAERAGHISHREAQHIQSVARAKLRHDDHGTTNHLGKIAKKYRD